MSHCSKIIEPKDGELPIYSWSVRSIGDHLDLQLTSEGDRGLGQSCKFEHLSCGIWHYLQVDSIKIELNCRTHSWCQRIAWQCEKKKHTHTHNWNWYQNSTPKGALVAALPIGLMSVHVSNACLSPHHVCSQWPLPLAPGSLWNNSVSSWLSQPSCLPRSPWSFMHGQMKHTFSDKIFPSNWHYPASQPICLREKCWTLANLMKIQC